MTISTIAAWVTVIASPAAVVGVFLVWKQLLLMRQDRLKDDARRTAAILPTISVLRLRAEADWGCDIVDNDHRAPPDELLDQIASRIKSDLSLMSPLQARCADIGLNAVVLASMLETDLTIMSYYLKSVVEARSRDEKWKMRWPRMVRTAFHYWELLHRLEATLPGHARLIGTKSPDRYRAEIAEDVKLSVERRTQYLYQGSHGIEWPPRST